jgi:Skp family chaperone for outer membrane proteins
MHMVRLSRAASAAVLLSVLAVPALRAQQPAGAAPRLAWLNSQVVLAATPGRAEAESLFNREMVGFRAEVQRLQQQLDSAVAEYNRASIAMTPQARQTREGQLREMEQRTRQRAGEIEQQAQQREAVLTRPILERVNAVIEGVRAEMNYAFVFDVSVQGNPIVTADRALDITQMVIQRLQAAGPAPAPPVADSGAAPAARPEAQAPARPRP